MIDGLYGYQRSMTSVHLGGRRKFCDTINIGVGDQRGTSPWDLIDAIRKSEYPELLSIYLNPGMFVRDALSESK